MKWAISLVIEESEILEKRIERILSYIFNTTDQYSCIIYDIDATGYVGDQLTKKMNENKGPLESNVKELIATATEDGQIFELDLSLSNSKNYRFIVRDGNMIDILGDAEKLPSSIVGDFTDLDIALFDGLSK